MSKDIDFDELDKAVSSLMGNVASDKAEEAQRQKVLTISGTLQPGEKPTYNKVDEAAKNIGNETLVTDGERTIVEDLDGGKNTDVTAADEKVVELTEVTLPEEAPTEEVTAAPAEPVRRAPSLVSVPRPAGGRFMDVVHPSSDMRTAAPAKVNSSPSSIPSSIPQPAVVEAPVAPPPDIANETPLTPFLPDAKVEKRPLGGGAVPSPFAEAPEETPKVEEAKPAEAEEPKIEETVSINSEKQAAPESGKQTVLDASSFESAPTAESIEIAAIESSEVTSLQSIESGDTEKLTVAGAPNKEGTIYDVANQPQPLAHPAKQKSGWGTVLIILLIIILAAALGVAAYFILGLGV